MFLKGWSLVKTWGILQIIALMVAYLVPYALLYNANGWSLYVYWLILGVFSVIVAWAGTKGWSKSG